MSRKLHKPEEIVAKQRILSFDELAQAFASTPAEITQLGRGRFFGETFNVHISGLIIDVGTFNVGLRTKGISNKIYNTIGMMLGSTDRVTRTSYESGVGDVMLTPLNSEFENRYYGGASIITIMVSDADLEFALGSESQLRTQSGWKRSHFKAIPDTVDLIIPRLRLLLSRLNASGSSLPPHASEFWRRAIIEAMTVNILDLEPAKRDGPLPSALKVVSQVEDYLDAQSAEPVHISQICNHLRIPRRTLHRAFHEAIGIGPISFLRYRRLCAAHTMLRSSPPDRMTISDIAIQHGFLSASRFAKYYHDLFGELPSESKQQSFDTRRAI